jgi:putative salt-induced outer membrane protein
MRGRRSLVAFAATAIGAMLMCAAVYAQEDEEEDEDRVSGRASVGFLATQGNTDSTNANARLRLAYALPDWSHDFDWSVVSASRDDQTTSEAYTANYKARREFVSRSYLFTALDSQRDRFSAYEYQMSESVGYGFRAVDRTDHSLSVEIGGGAQQAKFQDGTRQDEAILRSSLGYRWTVNDSVSVHQDLVVEHGASNTRTESLSEMRARLFGNVGLVLSYRVRRNSNVLPDRSRSDIHSSVSLEYAF